MSQDVHPVIARVTQRIRERSRPTREAYLQRIEADGGRLAEMPARSRMSCSNFAHGFAGAPDSDKQVLRASAAPNIGIVTAYNDMLSAHKPYEHYPEKIRAAARRRGATAQVAGGVPAMCDGVTQGELGMELSLFSRDTIALGTTIALSHEMFDGALLLGICDKIVPGLLMGALAFGHLPQILVPSGPMGSGLPNTDKSRIRQQYAKGTVTLAELLDAEAKSYHSPGTCTFYGTANSNQLVVEVMGLHLPGAAFVPPFANLRDALTEAAVARVLEIGARGADYRPIGRLFDERALVNGVVGLIATGGSTNHTIHLPAVARAAGMILDWDDFAELSATVPLLARIYPNGPADVNAFHQAGGTPYLIGQLLDAGLLHEDVETVCGRGLRRYARTPTIEHAEGAGKLVWQPAPEQSSDPAVLRPAAEPFDPQGGLALIAGPLGRAIVKVSAVKPEHQSIRAPARVFHTQDEVQAAFRAGELARDVVVVLRFQGPGANGMPELHGLMPPLGAMLDEGHRIALLTDGRLSGASGKVLSALHLWPEAAKGGPLARIHDGDIIHIDARKGVLDIEPVGEPFEARTPAPPDGHAAYGVGRELFALFRRNVSQAEAGASPLFDDAPSASPAVVSATLRNREVTA